MEPIASAYRLHDGPESLFGQLGQRIYKTLIIRHEMAHCNMFHAFASKGDFLSYCDGFAPEMRSFHEVIFGSTPQRIKMDIDMKGIRREEGDAMIRDLLSQICTLFRSKFSIDLPERSILVTAAHREGSDAAPSKLSYHIIVLGYSMVDSRHVSAFVDNLKLGLDPKLVPFIDNVYRSTQSFRVLGCTKADEYRPKLVSSDMGAKVCLREDSFISLNDGDEIIPWYLELPSYERRGDIPAEMLKKIHTLLPSLLPEIGSFRFRGTSGTIINYDRVEGSICSLCGIHHDRENSLFLTLDGGILRQHCRRMQDTVVGAKCRTIYIFDDEKSISPSRLERLGKRASNGLSGRMMNLDKYFAITERYSSPFLRDITDEPGVLYMKAPMKLGKTKCLKRYIETLPIDVSICFVSFRVAFSNALLSVMDGFVSYQDVPGSLNAMVAPRLVVQVESLPRVQGRYDIIVLDESESILSQFDSSCLKAKSSAIAIIAGLISSAGKVICMDAMMTSRTIEVIRKMREDSPPSTEKLSINEHKNGTDYTYQLTYSEPRMYSEMIAALDRGERIAFVSNSVTKVEQYYMAVRNRYKDLRMMSYTAKTDAGVKKDHMERINSVAKTLDVLMYSPTITAGVSIEIEHFDRVFSFFTNASCDAISSIQMLGRIRNVGSKQVLICFNTLPRDAPGTIEKIEKALGENSLELLEDATYLNLRAIPMGSHTEIRAERNMYYTMWLYNRLIYNQSLSCFEDFFLEYISSIGAQIALLDDDTIEDDEKAEIKAEMRDAKEQAKEAEANAIVDARDVTPQEVSALLASEDSLSLDDQRAIEKYKMKRFYGVKKVTVDSAKVLGPPHAHTWYTNLKVLLSEATMEQSIAVYKEREKERVSSLKNDSRDYESFFLSDYPKHKACIDLFLLLGVDNITTETSIDIETITSRIREKNWQIRLREIFRIFHLPDEFSVDLANMDDEARDKKIKRVMRGISSALKGMYGITLSKKGNRYISQKVHPIKIRKRWETDEEEMPQITWENAFL